MSIAKEFHTRTKQLSMVVKHRLVHDFNKNHYINVANSVLNYVSL